MGERYHSLYLDGYMYVRLEMSGKKPVCVQ